VKASSKDFLEEINQNCYIKKTSLLFQDKRLKEDPTYRKGVFEVFEWVDALSYFYLKKETSLQKEFTEAFDTAYKRAKSMRPSAYRDGLLYSFYELDKLLKKQSEK